MSHILSSLRSSFDKKNYSTSMIARIALNRLAQELNIGQLDGYLRHGTLYVYLEDQANVLALFQGKRDFLKILNYEISSYDSSLTISDLRNKQKRDAQYNEET